METVYQTVGAAIAAGRAIRSIPALSRIGCLRSALRAIAETLDDHELRAAAREALADDDRASEKEIARVECRVWNTVTGNPVIWYDEAATPDAQQRCEAWIAENGSKGAYAGKFAFERVVAYRPATAPAAQRAHPDCGCCAGDGSMCKSVCRHEQENPPGHYDAELREPSMDDLISALAACRDVFPEPERGSPLDDACVQAIASPLAVPQFVREAVASEMQDAARWRALLNCARVRPLGSAGCERDEEHNPDYAHVGFELWTHYRFEPEWVEEAARQREVGKKWLERFVQKAMRVSGAAGTASA